MVWIGNLEFKCGKYSLDSNEMICPASLSPDSVLLWS